VNDGAVPIAESAGLSYAGCNRDLNSGLAKQVVRASAASRLEEEAGSK
jgi:hypothetical protein